MKNNLVLRREKQKHRYLILSTTFPKWKPKKEMG
jgi:hypothetical protein